MEQYMIALEKANDFRLRRAALKREIKEGEVTLSEYFLKEPPEWLAGEPIGRLLRAAPRVGVTRARKLLTEEGIRENRTVGKLTKRQRLILHLALRRIGR